MMLSESDLAIAMERAAACENRRLKAVLREGDFRPPPQRAGTQRNGEGQRARVRLIVSMARAGKTSREIEAETGATQDVVRKACKRHGVDLPPARVGPQPRAQSIHRLARAGLTSVEIAEAIGCSPDAVRRSCKDWGVPLTPAYGHRPA